MYSNAVFPDSGTLNLEVYESSSSQIHLDNHPVMKNLRQVTMMIMMKAKKILRPATKMREIMTVMSRNVTGINTATEISFIYSFSGNSTASAPISTFMCL
jgi:hypothetical protein